MKSPHGKVIVSFRPYRRDGKIEIPDAHKEQSVEALIVDDSAGKWEPGTKVIVSRLDGTYWKADEESPEKYCTVKRESVLLIYTEHADGKIATVRPAGRACLVSDEEPIKAMGGFELPDAFHKLRNYGKVFATGTGEWDFNVGDTIHFEAARAGKIKIDGQSALLVPEELIVAVQVELQAA